LSRRCCLGLELRRPCPASGPPLEALSIMWPAGVLNHRPSWKAQIVFFEVSCGNCGDHGDRGECVFLKTTRKMQTLDDEIALLQQCLREQPENHPALMVARLAEIQTLAAPTGCSSFDPTCPDTQLDDADTVLDVISVSDSEPVDRTDSAEWKGWVPQCACVLS
jgi:hypothetical protein